MTLKKKFEIALAIAGMTNESFASRFGVTEAAVRRAASGTMKSRRLKKEIESFISTKFSELKITSSYQPQHQPQEACCE